MTENENQEASPRLDNEESRRLLSQVNASGFLLQLGIEHQVKAEKDRHEWEVLAREHPWRDRTTGDEGYVDLILQKGAFRMLIECKRTRGARWVFLAPEDRAANEHRVRCQWLEGGRGLETLAGCDDFRVAPKSPEAQFCVVRGQGDADQPLLERLSRTLLKSLESFAVEEHSYEMDRMGPRLKMYLPAIVTTSELQVCRFNPAAVSLETGELPEGQFSTVPLVRFRKSLTTTASPRVSPKGVGEANADMERTVLVINASALNSVLKDFEFVKLGFWEKWPWTAAREILPPSGQR